MTVYLANRQRAKLSVEYNSTRRKKGRRVSAISATRDRTGDGTDGKRRRTSNARCNRKPNGRAGAPGEQRATKRENGTGGAEMSGGRRATKRENGTDGKETSSGERATGWEAGIAREGDGKPLAKRRKINASCSQQRTQPNEVAVTPE